MNKISLLQAYETGLYFIVSCRHGRSVETVRERIGGNWHLLRACVSLAADGYDMPWETSQDTELINDVHPLFFAGRKIEPGDRILIEKDDEYLYEIGFGEDCDENKEHAARISAAFGGAVSEYEAETALRWLQGKPDPARKAAEFLEKLESSSHDTLWQRIKNFLTKERHFLT